ncbi:MAG: hypothetical protein D6797_08335, partial [Bdellovibrio sp.]
QKMFFEFLMYQDLFHSWGWESEIADVTEIKKDGDQLVFKKKAVGFIYNRYCDFLLNKTESALLRQAYVNQWATFSPNPREYLLLADKMRLVNWSDESFLKFLPISSEDMNFFKSVVPETRLLSDSRYQEEIIKNKRKYFFKPQRSHGGKSVYRGKNITQKNLERLLKEPTIAQKNIPPPTITLEDKSLKWDLRVYAYKDEVQCCVARIYEGQLTNFNSPLGGFALIKVV